MRVLIATDAWHPQVNGVVRSLTSMAAAAASLGIEIDYVSHEGLATIPLPSYPDIRLGLPSLRYLERRISTFRPEAIHVATEGSIGLQMRRLCVRQRIPFTTSFTTRFPEYIASRVPPFPLDLGYAVLRRFHGPAQTTMVATQTLKDALERRGFRKLAIWPRGVDASLFRPDAPITLDLPRPIFMNVGRIACEKNLDAFLRLDLPGSKVVIGKGPQAASLKAQFPKAHFLGEITGPTLTGYLSAADVFVFPSRTDTFGNVQLEALACGVPVAAYPVPGPLDVIGTARVGVLDNDLRAACLSALALSRQDCRNYALTKTWEASAKCFVQNLARF